MTPADEHATRALSFGAVAEDYDRFRPGPPAAGLAWMLPPSCRSAVDIGAGTGALTRLLVQTVPTVYAVEPDPRMAEFLASRIPAARVMAGRAEQMPLTRSCADAVVGSSMWHWVDEERAVLDAARVLRPGGVLGVLWGGPDPTQPGLAELMATARRSREADGEQRARHRHELRLPAGAPFSAPEAHTEHWTVTVRPDDLVALACTYSGFIILPDEQKQQIRSALTTIVQHHPALAGRRQVELSMRARCWRAVRQ